MLSNIFGRQPVKNSVENDRRDFFNLKQFRANFKRETEVQKEQNKSQMSISRYSQSKFYNVDKDLSYRVNDRYQQLNRYKKSPESSRRNNSFVFSSQIHIPNFIRESERNNREKRYSLSHHGEVEQNLVGSKIKDTSTVNKYSARTTHESQLDNKGDKFKFNHCNIRHSSSSKFKGPEAPLQIQQNLDKVKRALSMRDSMIEQHSYLPLHNDSYDKHILKTIESKNDNESIELISRIQNLKDRLDIKMESSKRIYTEPSLVDDLISKKTTFKDVDLSRPVTITKRVSKLETRLPIDDIKILKATFETIDIYELNQLPNK